MAGGRPKLYNTREELQKVVDDYFEQCDLREKPYTMSGLAYALNMSRQSLINYSKDEEFFDTYKKAREKVEQCLEENLYRLGNNSGIIFNLKNNFGWKDNIQVESKELSKVDELLNNIKKEAE